MKERNAFTPSRSYWKELDKLDQTVFDMAEEASSELIRRKRIIDVRAMWDAPDNESMPIRWRGKKTESGLRILGDLAIISKVESLVGLRDPEEAAIYRYSPSLRMLRVSRHMLVDPFDTEVDRNLSEEDLGLANSIGSIVDKDSYEVLIDEMRRGASGNFTRQLR